MNNKRIRDLATDRRFIIVLVTELLLFVLGYFKAVEVAEAMALLALSLAGANAFEKAAIAFSPHSKKAAPPPAE